MLGAADRARWRHQTVAVAAAELTGDVGERGLGSELLGKAGGDDHLRILVTKKAGSGQLVSGLNTRAHSTSLESTAFET